MDHKVPIRAHEVKMGWRKGNEGKKVMNSLLVHPFSCENGLLVHPFRERVELRDYFLGVLAHNVKL